MAPWRQGRRRSTRPHSWGDGEAVEVDRVISPAATFALGGHVLTASTLLAGRQVGIRIEPSVLLLFDLDTRELLRTQPNPLTKPQVLKLRGLRPAGPPPRPNLEPVTVQRLADATGTICVAKQRIGCGRVFARQTLTVHVSDTAITIELGDGDKSHRPPHHHDGAHYHQVQAATNGHKNLALLTHINWHKKEAHQPGSVRLMV